MIISILGILLAAALKYASVRIERWRRNQALVEYREAHTLYLYGRIDFDSAVPFFRDLARLAARGSPDIEICIDSEGGEADNGQTIYELIRDYGGHVTGVVRSDAASAAAMILQACDTRQAMQNARILIHEPTQTLNFHELGDREMLVEVRNNLMRIREAHARIFSDRSRKATSEIMNQFSKGEYMTTEEALAFGLIDEVVPGPFWRRPQAPIGQMSIVGKAVVPLFDQ